MLNIFYLVIFNLKSNLTSLWLFLGLVLCAVYKFKLKEVTVDDTIIVG